ncbi:hypothetical protein B5807_05060 [Epicoccum nigrum]|jgi:hypothetical protein|uniref:Uncharacterized protein n=1 Tax=Epicoccum nigrum TaxID=105696 RepID=A0A1Y2M524_EPING|nr:hypothetical protein B5807_05060 [Epicoccum nigrum]
MASLISSQASKERTQVESVVKHNHHNGRITLIDQRICSLNSYHRGIINIRLANLSRKGTSNRNSTTKSSLLLAAADSVLDASSSVAETVLSLLQDTLALVLGVVRAATGGVTELLGSGLLALCEEVSF